MHESSFYFTVISLLIFLLSGATLQLISKKIHVPFTLLLVLLGVFISLWSDVLREFFFQENTGIHSFSHTLLEHIGDFRLSPDIVFYVFLPVLVFESAFNLRFKHLRRSLGAISSLALVGLALSTVIIGFFLHYILHIPLSAALLFGIIISATDPVAVLGTFKEVGAPRRLRTIVEGESLFNDGTALVIFHILLGIIYVQSGDISGGTPALFHGLEDFVIKVFGGVLFGIVLGILFSKAIHLVRDNPNVEMTLALILAHSAFLFAEHIGVSGIISTVIAGVILGNFGRNKISPEVLETMRHFWDHMAFIVNSLVFILIGIAIAKSSSIDFFVPSVVAVFVVIIARFLSIIPVLSALSLFTRREADKIPFSWQVIISHGGLRGALAIVMLFLIPGDYEYLEMIQSMTVAVVITLFLCSSTTIEWMLKQFGLMKFTPVNVLEIEESHVLVAHSMREHLKKIYHKRYIGSDVYNKISSMYKKSETKANRKITSLFKKQKAFSENELLLILKKHCLGVEKKVFHQLFAAEEISEHTLAELSGSVERQRERLMLEKPQEKRKSPVPFRTRLEQKEEIIRKILKKMERNRYVKRWIKNWKKKQILHKHERYRSRRISALNVLKHLNELRKNELFLEGTILESVYSQYQRWHENAKNKQIELETIYSEFLKDRRFYLTKRNCLGIEKKLIKNFLDREIITKKVYISLSKSIEKRMRKIRKDATSDEEQ
jgi:CPA1 family monovalent cation:H+ antiporter